MLAHQSERRMKLRSHGPTPLANVSEQLSAKKMRLITMLEAKQSKTTSEALIFVGTRRTAPKKAEKRPKAEQDRDTVAVPQLSLASRCEYHRSILEGMICDTSKGLTPIERFSREIPAKHFAFHVQPDTGQASTRQACSCMLFLEEMLDISEDELEQASS